MSRIVASGGVDAGGARYAINGRKAGGRGLGLAREGVAVAASDRLVVVTFGGRYLASHSVAEAVEHATEIARAVCLRGARLAGGEVWDLDVCADLAGATFRVDDVKGMVMRLCKVMRWCEDCDRRGEVTGLRFGSVRALSVTIYDKVRQLRGPGRAMTDEERAIWKANEAARTGHDQGAG